MLPSNYATKAELIALAKNTEALAERVAKQFREAGLSGILTVPEAPEIVVDISQAYPTFAVTLTGNRTLNFIGGSAALDRRKILIEVRQGTTGYHTLTPTETVIYGSAPDLQNIVLTNEPGAVDLLGFVYVHELGAYRYVAHAPGF